MRKPPEILESRRRQWRDLSSRCYPVWFSGAAEKPICHEEDFSPVQWAWEFLRRNSEFAAGRPPKGSRWFEDWRIRGNIDPSDDELPEFDPDWVIVVYTAAVLETLRTRMGYWDDPKLPIDTDDRVQLLVEAASDKRAQRFVKSRLREQAGNPRTPNPRLLSCYLRLLDADFCGVTPSDIAGGRYGDKPGAWSYDPADPASETASRATVATRLKRAKRLTQPEGYLSLLA